MLLIRPLPVKEESFRGYLFRVSNDNGLMGIRHLLSLVKNAYSEAPDLTLLNWLGRDTNELHHLAGLVPKADGHQGKLKFAKKLPDRYWNVSSARYCPLCLQEHPVWQSYWELALVVACYKHQIRLIDNCTVCWKPLSWHRLEFMKCQCGQVLVEMPMEVSSAEEHQLATIQYSLLNEVAIANDPMKFRDWNLLQFTRLIWFLGAYSINRRSTRPQKVDGIYRIDVAKGMVMAAGELLDNWPANFKDFLQEIGESQMGARSLKGVFGHFYHVLYRDFQGEQFRFLHQAFEEFLNTHWKGALNSRHRRFSKEVLKSHTMVPLPKIAKELKLSRTTIQFLVQQGKLKGSSQKLPSGRSVLAIEMASVSAYQQEKQGLISFDEARKMLGLGKRHFRELIQADAVKAKAGPVVDGKSVWGFSRNEMEVLAHSPEKLVLPEPINQSTEILFSIPEVAKRLGIKQEVAYHVVRHGYLDTIPFPGKRTNTVAVTEEGLQIFQNTYVAGAELAKLMSISPRYLKPEMELRGVYPCCGPEVDGCRQYFYRRIELQLFENIQVTLQGS